MSKIEESENKKIACCFSENLEKSLSEIVNYWIILIIKHTVSCVKVSFIMITCYLYPQMGYYSTKQNKNLKVNFLRSNKKKTRNGRKFLENQNKKNVI